MRVLILGGDGMLGHRLMLDLSRTHEVQVTLRRDLNDYACHGLYTADNSHTGIDASNAWHVIDVIGQAGPDVVVNAIGIIKQRKASSDMVRSLEINALLPHRLAIACRAAGARLIHVSTDCVFAGDRGGYREEDRADATDVYGRTKYLGEVTGPGCVTLRTSIIGLELRRRHSLIEWYLAQTGRIRGFTGAIFNGLTTMEFSRVTRMLIERFTDLSGVYQVCSEPISKYELLRRLTDMLGRTDVDVVPDHDFKCDRSLKGNLFEQATGYTAPTWSLMLDELAHEIRKRQEQ